MTRPIREIVGERVLLLRRRARLSQPELAQQAEMSVTTLNRVENAHQSLYMEKIAALATALGTTADYLLGLSDDPGRASERPSQEATAQPVTVQPPTKPPRTRKATPVT
jgi:transcriptional regulator with XRE-family HTH domain